MGARRAPTIARAGSRWHPIAHRRRGRPGSRPVDERVAAAADPNGRQQSQLRPLVHHSPKARPVTEDLDSVSVRAGRRQLARGMKWPCENECQITRDHFEEGQDIGVRAGWERTWSVRTLSRLYEIGNAPSMDHGERSAIKGALANCLPQGCPRFWKAWGMRFLLLLSLGGGQAR